jgi:hypothetical protein
MKSSGTAKECGLNTTLLCLIVRISPDKSSIFAFYFNRLLDKVVDDIWDFSKKGLEDQARALVRLCLRNKLAILRARLGTKRGCAAVFLFFCSVREWMTEREELEIVRLLREANFWSTGPARLPRECYNNIHLPSFGQCKPGTRKKSLEILLRIQHPMN